MINSVRREAGAGSCLRPGNVPLHCNYLVMYQIRMLFSKTHFSLYWLCYYGPSNHGQVTYYKITPKVNKGNRLTPSNGQLLLKVVILLASTGTHLSFQKVSSVT